MTVEYCIASTIFKYWNDTTLGFIYRISKFSVYRCSTRSEMALDLLYGKQLQGRNVYLS